MEKELSPRPLTLKDTIFTNEEELNLWLEKQILPEFFSFYPDEDEDAELPNPYSILDEEEAKLAIGLPPRPLSKEDLPSDDFINEVIAFYLQD